MSEADFHKAVAEFLDRALPPDDAFWTTIPAGGGGPIRGRRLKEMGYKPGTPDILIIYRGQAFFLELKSTKGRESPQQNEVAYRLLRAGADRTVARTMQHIERACVHWGIPIRAKIGV